MEPIDFVCTIDPAGHRQRAEKDRYSPVRLVDRFIARLPTVEHHVLPDFGHLLHDDCPEQAYSLLSPFLQQDT